MHQRLALIQFLCGAILLSQLCAVVEAKVFTKCGLKTELEKQNVSGTYLGTWMCVIRSESRYDTSKQVDQPNRTKNLGLFQINDKDWCTYKKPGGHCNMKCEDLLNDDISDDCKCAEKYRQENGWKVWIGWNRYCYNQREATTIPQC